MKITVKQLRHLIKEEVKKATSHKMRRLYESEEAQEMPSSHEVLAAAERMTPREARQVVKDAGIDMRELLQNPEIQELIDQAAEEIAQSETSLNEYGDADPRQGLAITGIMVGVPTIASGLFDMALGIQQYAPDAHLVGGHGPSAFVMGGIAVILASLAAQRAANRTK